MDQIVDLHLDVDQSGGPMVDLFQNWDQSVVLRVGQIKAEMMNLHLDVDQIGVPMVDLYQSWDQSVVLRVDQISAQMMDLYAGVDHSVMAHLGFEPLLI